MLNTNSFKQITNKIFMSIKQRIRLVKHLRFLRTLIIFAASPACTLPTVPATVSSLHINSYITSC